MAQHFHFEDFTLQIDSNLCKMMHAQIFHGSTIVIAEDGKLNCPSRKGYLTTMHSPLEYYTAMKEEDLHIQIME